MRKGLSRRRLCVTFIFRLLGEKERFTNILRRSEMFSHKNIFLYENNTNFCHTFSHCDVTYQESRDEERGVVTKVAAIWIPLRATNESFAIHLFFFYAIIRCNNIIFHEKENLRADKKSLNRGSNVKLHVVSERLRRFPFDLVVQSTTQQCV